MSALVESYPEMPVPPDRRNNRLTAPSQPLRAIGGVAVSELTHFETVRSSGPEGWRLLAACRGEDTEKFYPEVGGSSEAAIRICKRCIVQNDCLKDALKSDEQHGVWGGLTERQRRKLKRRQVAR